MYVVAFPLKKFSVVGFLKESNLEIIPTKWIVKGNIAKWPPSCSEATIRKLIRSCADPEESWGSCEIKVYFKTNSFTKATQKLEEARYTSTVGSDSSETETEISLKKRKIKIPSRFVEKPQLIGSTKKRATFTDSNQQSQDLLHNLKPIDTSSSDETCISNASCHKQHQIPELPSHFIQCSSLELSSAEEPSEPVKQIKLNTQTVISSTPKLEPMQASPRQASPRQASQTDVNELKSLFMQLLKLHEKSYLKLKEMDKKQEELKLELCAIKEMLAKEKCVDVLEISNVPNCESLPLNSDEELILLNEELKLDKNMQSKYIKFLYHSCVGRNESTFITTCLRKLMARNVAVLYSRLGRKGKKSFMELPALYNIIIGAATMKFPDSRPDDLAEKLGKALATSVDWDGRKINKPGGLLYH